MKRASLVLFAVGCSGQNVVGSVLDPNAPPVPSLGFQLKVGPFDVPVGTEVQLCRTMKLPNDQPVSIDRLQISTQHGAHHTLIFRSADDVPDQVFPCWGAINFSEWELMAEGNRSGGFDWQLADGTAFVLRPHQQLMIQSHYVNATTLQTPGQGIAYVNMYASTRPVVTQAHAQLLVDVNLQLPPHTRTTVSKQCTLVYPVSIFALSSQFNSRGIEFTVDHLGPGGLPLGQLYDNTLWDSPLFKVPSPPTPIPSGDALRWSCTYYNETDALIGFGSHADVQERCDLIVFYTSEGTPLTCAEGGGW
jgi:hypothetical protein